MYRTKGLARRQYLAGIVSQGGKCNKTDTFFAVNVLSELPDIKKLMAACLAEAKRDKHVHDELRLTQEPPEPFDYL